MSGWIKLQRQLKDWEWYKDLPTKCLFLHLLISANHKPTRWQGIELQPGQCVTGLPSLAEQTGLSVRQVRTALDKLKMTNEVTVKPTAKYSIISIVKWFDYQSDDRLDDSPLTVKRQAGDSQATTDKNDNNNKNERITPISPKGYTPAFEAFWSAYPRKVNKLAAYRTYQTAIKQPGVTHEILVRIAADFAAAHSNARTEERFIPHPATWLNKGGWESDLSGIKPGTGATHPAANARGSQFSAVTAALAELLGEESGHPGNKQSQPADGLPQIAYRDDPAGGQTIDHDPPFPTDG